MEQLESAVHEGAKALAFMQFFLGVFITAGLSWLTATSMTTTAVGVYTAVLLVTGPASLWFGLQYFDKRKERLKIMSKIKTASLTSNATRPAS